MQGGKLLDGDCSKNLVNADKVEKDEEFRIFVCLFVQHSLLDQTKEANNKSHQPSNQSGSVAQRERNENESISCCCQANVSIQCDYADDLVLGLA